MLCLGQISRLLNSFDISHLHVGDEIYLTSERILSVTVKTVDIMTKNSQAQSNSLYISQGETASHPSPSYSRDSRADM